MIDSEKLKFILSDLLFDEDEVDYGGISREWFILIFLKITNPNYLLFKDDLEPVDADAYYQLVFIIVYDPSVLKLDYELKIIDFDQMKQKLTVNIGRQLHETQKDFHELLLYGRLKAFTSAELEIVLCEVDQIDFEYLKANIDYICSGLNDLEFTLLHQEIISVPDGLKQTQRHSTFGTSILTVDYANATP
ncbi:MAG: hypothetical protein EZS28_020496 [Streblomastix strix]|uniref:HECT-type E3 ubiquitin transferase n=1 Tax=Streblomastix strix TaxID=222440 RepID=A0A5J4VMV0_9EUKA|nr:MAG: hypothetical protein EZS28_020496 [Streblomastix strix]